ncbi:ABC transporter ATP-binding protein [Psychromonas arctica]|uniref:ABC transporter ATP-binding protein n=1 Tax=Psychromonas arctica TaxID=168275 RepID=A0ABU9HGF1_9GAMM
MLSVRHVSLSINQTCLLDDISFNVEAGETLAIVGESGAGKTLLSKLLLGLEPRGSTVQGVIQVAGKNTRDFSETEWFSVRGKEIGMVSQEPFSALNPVKSVAWHLKRILFIHRHHSEKSILTLNERVTLLLEQVDLPASFKSRYPHQLSGGQRQRLLIAIAIANKPKLLVADEPSTALDPNVRQQILTLLKTIQQQTNMAIVLISHDLNLVKQVANTVAVFKEGCLIEIQKTADLFNKPIEEYTRSLMKVMTFTRPKPIHSDVNLNVKDLSVVLKTTWWWQTPHYLLSGISFSLKKGESLGLIGQSGSGKSTLAKSLLRLIPAKGKVIFDSHEWLNEKRSSLRLSRYKMQFVFQDNESNLNPRMKIAQSLSEGPQAQGRVDNLSERITQVLIDVDLPLEVLSRYPHQLSGGQRQRIMIARALILESKLLILDEPTTALDQKNRYRIIVLLKKIQAQRQVSLILITHDWELLTALCHQVMTLDKGKLSSYQSVDTWLAHKE